MQAEFELKLLEFFSLFPLLSYRKKEIIYRQGEIIDQVAFVKKGFVKLYSTTSDGKEKTINLFKPVFPISLINSAEKIPLEYTMEAVTDVQLWKVSRTDFDEFLINNPQTCSYINTMLARICKELINNVNNILSSKADQKISGIIHAMCMSTGMDELGGKKISLETTHSLIASMTGLTRETVSIQIKKLERKGVIRVKNSYLTIPNLNKLIL